jgi:hypothetical protein
LKSSAPGQAVGEGAEQDANQPTTHTSVRSQTKTSLKTSRLGREITIYLHELPYPYSSSVNGVTMERDKKKGKGGGEWATLSTGHWDSLS